MVIPIIDIERKLLRVNLSTQSWSVEEIPERYFVEYIGGKGIGSKYLYDEVLPKTDPLGEQNKLIYVTGPITATNFPTTNRYGILFKSPLTGTYGESYSGGGAGEKIRAAGYSIVIIEGISKSPQWLYIDNKTVAFRSAESLWGKDTIETTQSLGKLLTSENRDAGSDVMCIGPAGENLVRFASVMNNHTHTAGRLGAGAVMGSKKLKALVFSGKSQPTITKKPQFKEVVQKIFQRLNEHPEIYGKNGSYRQYGTPAIVNWVNRLGCFPTKYFENCYTSCADQLNGDLLFEKFLKKRTACHGCPFGCGKYVEVTEGEFQCITDGPEYETIYAFGGLCDIHDITAIAKINDICDRMGLDTISTGSICGLAIESKRRNKIPGLTNSSLNYDAPKSVIEFIFDIVKHNGIAAEFSQGTKFVESKYHLEDFAMHIKGQDFAGYDPRAFRGFALSYGVSPEGPSHLRSTFHGIEFKMPNRLEYENKVLPMIEQEDIMTIIDSLIVCKFIRGVLDWKILVEIYNALFDTDITVEFLRRVARNIVTLSRKFNIREGFRREDDMLPQRAYNEYIIDPNGSKTKIDKEKYNKMLDEYYEARGWSKDGIPLD